MRGMSKRSPARSRRPAAKKPAKRPAKKPAKRPAKKTSKRPRAKPAAQPILSARNLVKDYETNGTRTRALDGLSLDLPPGGFISVMGPSGSGKSTLLHLLGGLDTPTSGEVELQGRALHNLDDKEITLARRGSVGFVFQFFNLVPVLTVSENIALPMVVAGARPAAYREHLEAVIERVGLSDCAEKLPSQISGGQQQRTAIARAIFPSPAVVLADEPTGNLDSHTGTEVLLLLRALCDEQGQTIAIVTHDPRAAAYGDDVIFLEDGRITSELNLSRKQWPRRSASGGAIGGEARAQAVLNWLQKLGA
jgi:putative ABC transport system ATP-binding protein